MADEGFEDAGTWSHDEVVGTPDLFGDPDGPTPRWRMGRRAAVAVGIAVALGAGGYGVAVAEGGSAATSNGATALPASLSSSASGGGSAMGRGCGVAFLGGVAGTLKSDNGSTLTVTGPAGNTRTVNTTSSTTALRIVSGSVSDVANGDTVLVGGTYANNTLTAKTIVTGSELTQASGAGKAPQGSIHALGRGFAGGTVADMTSSGFTVVTTDGAHVTVSTSAKPTVETIVKISVSDLRVGQRVTASGTPDSSGNLSATQIEELDVTSPLPGVGFGPGFGFGPALGFAGRGPGGPGGPSGLRAFGFGPQTRPSNAPTALPKGLTPPNGPNGFSFRARGRAPQLCSTATPPPAAPKPNA